jgi:sec-independent protein translocase protein TatB
MFDIAWSHLMVIALVALLVIGPKDLPRVLRTLGTWVGKARAIAREFQGSLDQMVREAELDEMKKHVEAATNVNIERELENTIDPASEMERSLSAPARSATPPGPAPLPVPPDPPPSAEAPHPVEPAKSGAHE